MGKQEIIGKHQMTYISLTIIYLCFVIYSKVYLNKRKPVPSEATTTFAVLAAFLGLSILLVISGCS